MKWTGLTGGIATGKSAAKKLIESLGIPVIDADQISHKLSEPGQETYSKIVSHFGNSILNPDLSIDRKKLGQIIFSNEQSKLQLEAILHPPIQAEVRRQREIHKQAGAKICFYDVPLLFEKNLWRDFDATVLIWCSPSIQLDRLMKRNNLTLEEAVLRIGNQIPLIDKVKMANYCIDNSGDLSDLEKQLQKLVEKLAST
ncbi:dephospho-CoA kinase [bacterium]|nr:dephospho-CoA kinase [bacterium]